MKKCDDAFHFFGVSSTMGIDFSKLVFNFPSFRVDEPEVGNPTGQPTRLPTLPPTLRPTQNPTQSPTLRPTNRPTQLPARRNDPVVNVQRNCPSNPDDFDTDRFDICLDLRVSESTIPFFEQAARTWESVNVGDQPSYLRADNYGPFDPGFPASNRDIFINLQPRFIDDLYISATERFVDGSERVLGFASPQFVNSRGYPVVGKMVFDEDDVARLKRDNPRLLLDTITHEMGHVQGLGTLWEQKGLFDIRDQLYKGPNANRVWQEACGGSSVPIQVERLDGLRITDPTDLSQRDGSVYGHWDESCLGEELMSPLLSAGSENPLSEMTVAGLQDLGWTVSFQNARSFSGPPRNSGCRVQCRNDDRNLRGDHDRNLFLKDLIEDGVEAIGDIADVIFSNQDEILEAARIAFQIMSEGLEDNDVGTPEGLEYVGGKVATVFVLDKNDSVRDVTFKWDDVKDLF